MFVFFPPIYIVTKKSNQICPKTCTKTHTLSLFTLTAPLCLCMWIGTLYPTVFHFYKVYNILQIPLPRNIQLRICQKHCLTLSKSSKCLHGNVTTNFHKSWTWKWGVSECDSNVCCVLGSQFGLLTASTVKRHWDENHKKVLRNKKTGLEIWVFMQ